MKKILTTALFVAASLSRLSAIEPRILIVTDKDTFTGYMAAADEIAFLWRENEESTLTRKQSQKNLHGLLYPASRIYRGHGTL
jgi:hypothetical protein